MLESRGHKPERKETMSNRVNISRVKVTYLDCNNSESFYVRVCDNYALEEIEYEKLQDIPSNPKDLFVDLLSNPNDGLVDLLEYAQDNGAMIMGSWYDAEELGILMPKEEE